MAAHPEMDSALSAPPVLLARSSPVWTLTLNRPQQGNACSAEMVAALDAALQQAEQAGVQALLLHGAGKHFCTGFDLSGLAQESDDSLLARFVRVELMLQRLARAPFLTIALGHGRVMGAGADLFACCAVRLARTGSSFSFPGARGFGLVLGTGRLRALVGADTALQWVETACTISTDEALQAGLCTGRVDDEPVQPIVQSLATRLHDDRALHQALRAACAPGHAEHDAQDLQRLVASAARPGLHARMQAYVAANSARRNASPP